MKIPVDITVNPWDQRPASTQQLIYAKKLNERCSDQSISQLESSCAESLNAVRISGVPPNEIP